MKDLKKWSFVLSGRWAGYLALVVIFSIISVGFGNWQFDRRDEARHAISLIENNYDLEPRPLSTVLQTLDAFDESQTWTPVRMTGEYLHDEELLVRNRPYRGHPGFEILTPLGLDDGTVFVVNRGWVEIGQRQDNPDAVPAAPEGRVTVEARLKAGEPTLPGRSARDGQIATIHLPDVAERVGLPTYTGAYGLVDTQVPAPAETPVTPADPEPDEGPHLSYALQWYVFAILAFIGLGWALRQEYRVVNSEDEAVRRDEEVRAQKRARKAPTDDEIEDSILDASTPAR